jgi:hypothetical protein
MLKTFSLAVTFFILPLAATAQDHDLRSPNNTCIAHAQEDDAPIRSHARPAPTETVEAFGERMRAFGSQAGEICADPNLNDEEKEARIAAAWTQHQPERSSSLSATLLDQSGATAPAPNGATLIADYALSQAREALQQAASGLAAATTRSPGR